MLTIRNDERLWLHCEQHANVTLVPNDANRMTKPQMWNFFHVYVMLWSNTRYQNAKFRSDFLFGDHKEHTKRSARIVHVLCKFSSSKSEIHTSVHSQWNARNSFAFGLFVIFRAGKSFIFFSIRLNNNVSNTLHSCSLFIQFKFSFCGQNP